jgi:hypothetical protein
LNHSILLLPMKADIERDAVAFAWESAGGDVLRLDKFWIRPDVDARSVVLYGPHAFSLVVAQVLGLGLMSPPDDLLLRASPALLKRGIRGVSLGEALAGPFPIFVKPIVPKAFRAAVWHSPDDLRAECKGLGPETAVVVSEVINIGAEARAWVLDGQVLSSAIYEGDGGLREASEFVARCARELPLPETSVIDAAFVHDRGWFLLESNAACGAG